MEIIQPAVRFMEKKMSQSPLLARAYIAPYKKVVQKEIELAGIDKKDRVLNVGCGAVPFTAIYVACLTNARVWAIDRDERAVLQARSLVEKMGLSDSVRVFSGAGEDDLPCSFTVALIALQVEPKEKVWKHLCRKAPGVAG